MGDQWQPMFGEPCGPWIRTFAWRPVFTFDGGTVWLRSVWKRHIFKHQYLSGTGPDFWWQWRLFAPPQAGGPRTRAPSLPPPDTPVTNA